MTPARGDVLPQPRQKSRRRPPRPCPGLSFKLPSAPQRSAASAPAAGATPPPGSQPPPRAPQTQQSPALQPRDGGGPARSPHAGLLAHKNHLFARRREQRKSLTSALVQQLKLGPGMRRGHRRSAPWCLRKLALGAPNLGRGKVCSPLWNSEATSELLKQRERERKIQKESFQSTNKLESAQGASLPYK